MSVVVPCFNEERTIVELLNRVTASPWVCEVVVVDDGSTDRSRALLAEYAHPMVRVHLQPRNMGKGAALRTGFGLVTGEYAVVQDADLEYSPDDYGLLIDPLERNLADVVYGSRFQSGAPHRVLYFWHTVGNRFLTLLSNMMTDLNLTDMETCYKVFRTDLLKSIPIRSDR
ncbi:MAG TPA: glycosyl transferase, partial [Acidimicrobiaceae bacterium]|nr:glycosyl transferase [Acidimicrobiaceae bacterium]